ncbi:MAG: hypothetical protein KAQ78_09595 [Candidatus Latescibacteria bacterium]|nr:hypothetical protein [Candidatus Latescibacterota bacterium]
MPLTKKDLEQIGEVIDQRVGKVIDQKVGGIIDQKVGALIDEKQEKLAGMIAREFQNINGHFKRVHEEFGRVHQRFSDVDLSIEKLTRRVQHLELAIIENREQHLQFDKRLEALYGKVDALDQKADGLDQKVDALDGRMSKVETELREIKHRIDRLSLKREDRDEQDVVRLTNRVDRLETVVFA